MCCSKAGLTERDAYYVSLFQIFSLVNIWEKNWKVMLFSSVKSLECYFINPSIFKSKTTSKGLLVVTLSKGRKGVVVYLNYSLDNN